MEDGPASRTEGGGGGGGGEGGSSNAPNSSSSSSSSPFISDSLAGMGVSGQGQHSRSASFAFSTPVSSGLSGSGPINRSATQSGDSLLRSAMPASAGAHPLQDRIPSFRNTLGGSGALTRTISPPNARPPPFGSNPSPPLPPPSSGQSPFDSLLGSASGSGSKLFGSRSFSSFSSASAGEGNGGRGGGGGAGAAAATGAPFSRTGPPPFRRMSSQDVAPTLDGLRQLARQGSWRAIVEKVKEAHKFLMFHPPDEALAFSAYHVLALMKLRMFGAAADELRSLGDLDDDKYRYESYPEIYHGKKGSLVPFALRWLHAELPHRLGQTPATIDRLYDLLARCNAQIDMLQFKKESPWIRRMSDMFSGSIAADVGKGTAEIDHSGHGAGAFGARVSLTSGMHTRSRSSPPVFAKFSTTEAAGLLMSKDRDDALKDFSSHGMSSAGVRREHRSKSRSVTPPKVPVPSSTGSRLNPENSRHAEPNCGASNPPSSESDKMRGSDKTDGANAAVAASSIPTLRTDLLQVKQTESVHRGKGEAASEGNSSVVPSHRTTSSTDSNDFGDFVSADDPLKGNGAEDGSGREEGDLAPNRTGEGDSMLAAQGDEGVLEKRKGGEDPLDGGAAGDRALPVSQPSLRKELSLADGLGLEIERALQEQNSRAKDESAENGMNDSDTRGMEDADIGEDHGTELTIDDKEGSARFLEQQWKNRQEVVRYSIINHHLAQKDFLIAMQWLERMLKETPREPVVLSKYGYVRLQLGDIEGARIAFAHAEQALASLVNSKGGGSDESGEKASEAAVDRTKESGADEKRANVVGGKAGYGDSEGKVVATTGASAVSGLEDGLPPSSAALVYRNRGLLHFALKQYGAAMQNFEAALEIDDSDVVAVANKALCLMYSRDLMGAIRVLEDALQRNPLGMFNETLVLDLCSMYELASANCADTKRMLSAWIMRFAPDDFDLTCTRL